MRKVFMFFVCLAILLGLIFAIRNAKLNNQENEIIDEPEVEDKYVHELNIPIMEIDSLNPLVSTNSQVQNILSLIYEPLVKVDKDESLVGYLATEWTEKDDYTYIIKLRSTASWHNGSSFTASDVIFTINSILNKNINSIYYDNVKNIKSIEKVDTFSVLITLNNPDEFFMYKLNFPIVPEYYFKNGDLTNNTKNNMPVGTGAFMYDSAEDNIIKLRKNINWWNYNENSRLDTIYLYKYSSYGEAIKAYKSADVDLIITTMSDWEKKFGTIGNNIYRFESSVYDMIVLNTTKVTLGEVSVRKAIQAAVNREIIVSKVFNSNASIADMPVHNYSKNYTSSMQSDSDIDKAKQILLNASWKFSNGTWTKGNYVLKYTLLVNEENPEQLAASEIVRDSLKEIGIQITLKKTNWKNLKASLDSGNYDMALVSVNIKDEACILDLVETGNKNNYAKYKNGKMNELINRVRSNCSDELFREFYALYKEECPYIGLYFRNNILLTNKSVKGGIEPFASNFYNGISTWCK